MVFITIGMLCWFDDLDELFQTIARCMKKDGVIIINEQHPFTNMLATESEEAYHPAYPANDVLFDQNGQDRFLHEQNLIISENQTALIMGCGHSGIVNIMEKAQIYAPTLCVGGFHLLNPITGKTVSSVLLDEMIAELKTYPQTEFYTCHCTGQKAYDYLSKSLANLSYLSCGAQIEG